MIFIQYPFHCNVKVLDLGKELAKTGRIKEDIALILGCNEFSLLHNGKRLHDEDVVPDNSTVHVSFSLPGGKGGFGSMLRAIGAQIEKTTNREACRDLSGRRLRDINEEQRLKKWISKEAEREEEKIKRRQARIERLKTKAPHKFFDFEYEKEISELPDRINDALSEGLQKAKQPKKRPHENSESDVIPKKSWIAEDFSGTSSDSDSDEKNAEGESRPKRNTMMFEGASFCCQVIPTSTPGSSKDSNCVLSEDTASKSDVTEENSLESGSQSGKEQQNMSEDAMSVSDSSEDAKEKNEEAEKIIKVDAAAVEKSDSVVDTEKLSSDVNRIEKGDSERESNKETEAKDDSPIELSDFQSVSELEALGLEKLKSALMMHGLKCGGTLSDRAQRLWKIRGLQPSEYPQNLLVKNKK